ncbi:Histone deacetylase complex, SIN3 component [Pelomyxa schiedti]|nr:Histone deacetylase complex, SIN3 component [Pelomyxa schiedti]
MFMDVEPQTNPNTRYRSALDFLDLVKSRVNREAYDEFLDVMKQFKNAELTTEQVVGTVHTMFEGYPELIEGFNIFLPENYVHVQRGPGESNMRAAESTPTRARGKDPYFDTAVQFVKTIKARCADEPEIYRSFLNILHEYKSNSRSIAQTTTEVEALFCPKYPDLFEKFTEFLPTWANN